VVELRPGQHQPVQAGRFFEGAALDDRVLAGRVVAQDDIGLPVGGLMIWYLLRRRTFV